MTPGSTSYENILEVENQGSQFSRFFKILAGGNRPIQHSDVLTQWLLAA